MASEAQVLETTSTKNMTAEELIRAVVVIDPRRRRTSIHRPNSPPQDVAATGILALPDLVPDWELRLAEIFR